MAKSKISFDKCHAALDNICVVFKYLLMLISNVISQRQEKRLYDFNTFRP